MSVDGEIIRLRRDLPDGAAIEFEQRPTGYRAYHYVRADGSDRIRFPSVTTVLGDVMPKHALMAWYEECGAEAAVHLERVGLLQGVSADRAIDVVREKGMGGKATAKKAAGRGTTVHAILETYLETDYFPNPASLPEELRGYVRGLASWLVKANPQPLVTERLVCHPGYGYAGRFDARVRVYGADTLLDLKTNRRCMVYPEACLQLAAYHEADVECGAAPPERHLLVAVGPDGSYAEARNPASSVDAWHKALALYYSLRSVEPQSMEAEGIAA